MIRITRSLAIDPADLSESFVRSSGPGGQNVNKLSTAVQLRYAVDRLAGMPPDMRERLAVIAGRRLTADGELIIIAERFRTQMLRPKRIARATSGAARLKAAHTAHE